MAKTTKKTAVKKEAQKSVRDLTKMATAADLVTKAIDCFGEGDPIRQSLASVFNRIDRVRTSDQVKADKRAEKVRARIEKLVADAKAVGIDVTDLLK